MNGRQDILRHVSAALAILVVTSIAAFVPAKEPAQSPAEIVEPPITASDREHWSFAPLRKFTPPHLAGEAGRWPQTPLDSFVLAALHKREFVPAPPAERDTLLRRATLQITGLPPSPEDRAEFLADRSPDAYERRLDRLQASPAFGDHASQPWLDLARFAETDGFEHDHVRPEAWRYRDWVISALNRDLPYDEFIRQQLAGDELAPAAGGKIAAGFCLAGPDMPDVNDQALRRHDLLNEMASTVGAVFLGLQLGCAQCHDHKYDPISQADFFRVRACFESSLTVARDKPAGPLVTGVWKEPARLWIRGEHSRPGGILQPAPPRVASDERAVFVSTESKESPRAALARWIAQPNHPLTTRVIVNRIWREHFGKGFSETPSDFGLLGEGPSHAELLDYLASSLPRWGWSLKKLRREILASAAYRQASRVPPGSAAAEQFARARQLDPDNRLLWRFAPRRLDGEAIRDSLLATAGLLTSERGGPGVMPPLPPELTQTLLKNQWKASERAADHYKRSIYLFARRNLRYPILEAFDRPDANASCPLRHRSTTALQSLLLLNSAESLSAARHLAGIAMQSGETPPEWLAAAHLRALGRPLDAAAGASGVEFLRRQALLVAALPPAENASPATPLPHFSGDPHWAAALVDYCLALVNSADFSALD